MSKLTVTIPDDLHQKIREELERQGITTSQFIEQAQLFHKPLDSLMVQEEIALAKFCRDPAIAVPAPVFVVNRCDFFLNRCIFVFFLHLLQMIVESSTGQLSD